MTEARRVPLFHLHEEVDAGPLLAARAACRDDPCLSGARLTFLPFILKALSVTAGRHPALSASFDEQRTELLLRAEHNIGVAIQTPSGLVVPNIKGVQRKSVSQLADELRALQAAAAAGRLAPEQLAGGTLSVSNIGAIGGTYATPMVSPPEVAILALGRLRSAPRFGPTGAVEAGVSLSLSWGADHRVLDGATLAAASNELKRLLEAPARLLLALK